MQAEKRNTIFEEQQLIIKEQFYAMFIGVQLTGMLLTPFFNAVSIAFIMNTILILIYGVLFHFL